MLTIEHRHHNGHDFIYYVPAIDTDSRRPCLMELWDTSKFSAAQISEALARFLARQQPKQPRLREDFKMQV